MVVLTFALAVPRISAARDAWAADTASPRPPNRATSNPIEERYLAVCGREDERLDQVARTLLARGDVSVAHADSLQRMKGEPHVWPRVWRIKGSLENPENVRKLGEWLASSPYPGELRCGIASSPQSSELLVVAAEAIADLDPIPMKVASER